MLSCSEKIRREGFKEGFNEAIEEARVEVALNMLKNTTLSLEVIHQNTGLSLKKVHALAQTLKDRGNRPSSCENRFE